MDVHEIVADPHRDSHVKPLEIFRSYCQLYPK